ncbi:MAG TPA: DNA polymerase III subunit gamma/tau [Vicinamibacterales bacterium]
MAYQVLARKWRPQRFDDVVGQEAVTRTLRNAITSGRLAHAFVFAGSRGCGKTTTARILARALNCDNGPTADPCGECDACVEIAQGRDIDVLEIDAASHTGIDNIREVVIAGLQITPVRDRYKIFIIDEVHQLSVPSFNALLKSIEEPPAHVVFMMATTELHKIPDTILSRSQVFEFKTISSKAIAGQLQRIAKAENVEVSDAALALVARAAEGSMRDAQSALDQVMAFAGATIGADDVSTVLGLVGRDLLLDIVEAVFDEDGPRAFALADTATEAGHDLRLVCRELTRVVRDMMILSVDPSRAADGELAEGESERITALARRCSREDLMRAFDLLTKAEQDIRAASHPRYYFEMMLLRWMHLRKLVPLVDLLEGGAPAPPRSALAPAGTKIAPTRSVIAPAASKIAPTRSTIAPTGNKLAPTSASAIAPTGNPIAPATSSLAPTGDTVAPDRNVVAPNGALKDALLAEIRSVKNTLYSLAVAQAQRIDVTEERITFTFAANQNVARMQLEQNRAWLESVAERLSGKRMPVTAVQSDTATPPSTSNEPAAAAPKRDLKAEALASSGVQAVLDVFPAEIREVEDLE